MSRRLLWIAAAVLLLGFAGFERVQGQPPGTRCYGGMCDCTVRGMEIICDEYGYTPTTCRVLLWQALKAVEPFVEPAEWKSVAITGNMMTTLEICDQDCEIKRLESRLADLKERRDRAARLKEARESMAKTLKACAP